MKLVNTTLEKGKGPIIGKLRNITLIEGDMQIGMRIFLSTDIEELIERDERFSKSNFGSRKNYSIAIVILQKRLIFDNSLILMKHTIYTIMNLQSCYDRQLPNVGSIVEELVGCNRNAMKLYTKIMPKLEHYVSTGYGISDGFYGGNTELANTGQGNKFSGNMYWDISCLIIKQLEISKLRICFHSLATRIKVLRAAVSFVDDNNLAVDGQNAVNNIQVILNQFNSLHTATGGKM